MCGIAGVFLRDDPRPVAETRLLAMISAIRHRGPDGDGFHIEPHIGLGFCRLAIIDIKTGAQPLSNEDGTVWLVFNGEIYNYQELASQLRAKGHTFRTHSDSETIVHAYEEWGDDCVEHLRGIFAFAIWDRKRQRLLLARDRSGVKPLYLCENSGSLSFASEAKALLVDQPQTRALDLMGYTLRDELEATFERTPLRGVRALGAGCVLAADTQWMSARRYWTYAPSEALDDNRSVDDWVDCFRAELERSVKEQVMSEVPIGAYLSGGIDSAAVVACMSRMPLGEFQTLTTVNRFVGEDERFARMCVDALKLTRPLYFDYDQRADSVALLPLIAWMSEGELDAGYVSRYQLARYAANAGIKVVLTGQGIDEILTGYFPTFDAFMFNFTQHKLAARGGVTYRGLPPWRKEHFSAILGATEDRPPQEIYTKLATRALRDQHHALSRGLLRFEDRMGMAASVEVRVPLLDHELIEAAARIPQRKRHELLSGKAILRRAAAPWLPAEVVNRPKFAFNATLLPLTRLLEASGAVGDEVRALVSEERLKKTGYFDPAEVTALRAQRNYLALDHVLIVQLLDSVFVSDFDATRFVKAPDLRAVLPSERRGEKRAPAALTAETIPSLHRSLHGVSTNHLFDAERQMLVTQKTRADFVERDHEPVFLSDDVVTVLALVDGVRSFAQIAIELGEGITIEDLLEFSGTLIQLGVIAVR